MESCRNSKFKPSSSHPVGSHQNEDDHEDHVDGGARARDAEVARRAVPVHAARAQVAVVARGALRLVAVGPAARLVPAALEEEVRVRVVEVAVVDGPLLDLGGRGAMRRARRMRRAVTHVTLRSSEISGCCAQTTHPSGHPTH